MCILLNEKIDRFEVYKSTLLWVMWLRHIILPHPSFGLYMAHSTHKLALFLEPQRNSEPQSAVAHSEPRSKWLASQVDYNTFSRPLGPGKTTGPSPTSLNFYSQWAGKLPAGRLFQHSPPSIRPCKLNSQLCTQINPSPMTSKELWITGCRCTQKTKKRQLNTADLRERVKRDFSTVG